MAGRTSSPNRLAPLINAGTLAVFVAWLVAASYALTYLVSH
jgi:hypothetical protein